MKVSDALFPSERLVLTAVANTVIGYLPGYAGPSAVVPALGKVIAMTDRRILVADISLPGLRMEPPVASPLSDVSILSLSGPSWMYPFTDMTLVLATGQHLELRFTRRWIREVDVMDRTLHPNAYFGS